MCNNFTRKVTTTTRGADFKFVHDGLMGKEYKMIENVEKP